MGVSFPATFSSHFNSKAILGRRAASHSQFSPGENKGDSLDIARDRRKSVWVGEWWQTYPREDYETPATQLLKINHTGHDPTVTPMKPLSYFSAAIAGITPVEGCDSGRLRRLWLSILSQEGDAAALVTGSRKPGSPS